MPCWVGDLVEAPPALGPGEQPSWVHRLRGERDGERSRVLTGEELLLEQGDVGAPFSAAELVTVLARLTGLDEDQLQTRAGRMLTVPVAAAPRVEDALSGLRAALPPAVEIDYALTRRDAAGVAVLLSGTQHCRPGVTEIVVDAESDAALWDYDVEIAQGAAIADPVLRPVDYGGALALRVRSTLPGDAVIVEAVCRVARRVETQPIDPSHPGFGPIDRIGRRVGECGAAFWIARGGSSAHRWSEADGAVLELVCSARWEPPVVAAGPRVIYSSPLLKQSIAGFSTSTDIDAGEYTDERVAEVLDAVLDARVDWDRAQLVNDKERSTGTLVMVGAKAGEIAAELQSLVGRLLTPAVVDVVVLDVAAGTEAPAWDAVPDHAVRLASVSGPVLTGIPVCFVALEETSYLADWGVEVAQSARIPAPSIGIAEHGHTFNLNLYSRGGERPDTVLLDCAFVRLTSIQRSQARLSVPMLAPEAVSGSSHGPVVYVNRTPAVQMAADAVALEKAVTRMHRVTSAVPLDADGTATLRRGATELVGPGRELLVMVRVR